MRRCESPGIVDTTGRRAEPHTAARELRVVRKPINRIGQDSRQDLFDLVFLETRHTPGGPSNPGKNASAINQLA